VLITAACRAVLGDTNFSYGGRNEAGPVISNGNLQRCKYMNCNVVLVPKIMFKAIGNLSNDYTHGIVDFDYVLRAAKNGYNVTELKTMQPVVLLMKALPDGANLIILLKKNSSIIPLPSQIKNHKI
jgi:hypothetical protein